MTTPDPAPPGSTSTVTLVAALARNRVIGNAGGIPWRLPGEQAMFKALTTGHVLVMGRLTYESIGRPLPGRRTVVITRRPGWRPESGAHPDVFVTDTVDRALDLARELDPSVFVVGGGEIYAAALPLADAMVLTWVELEPEGDTYFPEFDPGEWSVVSQDPHDGYTAVHYVRIPPV